MAQHVLETHVDVYICFLIYFEFKFQRLVVEVEQITLFITNRYF